MSASTPTTPRVPSEHADHPALERLAQLDRVRPAPPAMGYQPALDGLRAMSVLAVILYHGGFGWMHGGFFGVEVFFVVSGFLITSLLLDERERYGAVSLPQFWQRRARRLLPALFTMMLAVGVWAALWGSPEVQSQLRRDFPWSIFYAANWGQILGDVPYFQPGSPSPFRHLWSLAVEEQWYVLWPLAFVGLAALGLRHAARGRLLVGASAAVMVLTWWLARAPELSAARVNFLYLGTLTRASGLLLGAGMAFLWRPWRSPGSRHARGGRVLDVAGGAAVVILLVAFATAELTDRAVYRWVLPVVTVASMVAVMAVVHPAAWVMRRLFGSRPMVEVGKRSYGLYLWTWPVAVVVDAHDGSWGRFALMLCIALPVSEACYRWVETPIRTGALGRWRAAPRTRDWGVTTAAGAVAVLALVAPTAAFFASVEPYDPAADTSEVVFDATAATVPVATEPVATVTAATAPVETAPDASVAPTTSASVPVTAPRLPRSVVVVGDSQAHSLAINLPSGIESTFTVTDGSVEGCSVYSDGTAVSSRDGFRRSFGSCAGWEEKWGRAAAGVDVALVVLGAWDVFDVRVGDTTIGFGTPAFDQRFTAGLQRGIDALTAAGAEVALLEVPCMRPQDVKGAGVPALPERGDDSRVAHLNRLLRQVAAARPGDVTYVAGPAAWCADESVSANLAYRWDGVHVYKPGAKLIYETIAPALLAIPVTAG